MIESPRFRIVFAASQIVVLLAAFLILRLMPGAPVSYSLAGFSAVWAATSCFYRMNPCRSRGGWWILLAVTAFLSLGIIANIHVFTTPPGADSSHPVFVNNDATLVWQRAVMLNGFAYDPDIASPDGPFEFALFVAPVLRIFGCDVIYPLLVNMLCILVSVVMAGMLYARTVAADKSGSTAAMLFLSITAYFVSAGAILLKDAPLSASVSALMLGLTFVLRPSASRRLNLMACGGMIMALMVMALCRPPMLLLAAVGIVAVLMRRTALRGSLPMMTLLVIVLMLYSVVMWLNYSDDVFVKATGHLSDDVRSDIFAALEPTQKAYDPLRSVIGESVWTRIAFLPLSCAVQFLIPLPWNLMAHAAMGYTLIYAHLGFGWYVTGGLAAFGYIFGMGRMPYMLRRMSLWALAMYVFIAFMYEGTISRYCLPFMPIWAALAAWALCLGKEKPRKFRNWIAIYASALSVILVIAYFYTHAD